MFQTTDQQSTELLVKKIQKFEIKKNSESKKFQINKVPDQ